jgi:hypothetical protein
MLAAGVPVTNCKINSEYLQYCNVRDVIEGVALRCACKRTDASFREEEYPGHHKGTSPFCGLSIDMVKTFPIDYMHQCCMGVTRKLLQTWLGAG